MRTVKVVIKGRVQGVFFRRFIYENAIKLDLNGYVRNINDDIEAIFSGSDSSVEKMLEICRKGPSGSKIDKIEVKELKEERFDEFEIIY